MQSFLRTAIPFAVSAIVIGAGMALAVHGPSHGPWLLALYAIVGAALVATMVKAYRQVWARPIRDLDLAAGRMAGGEWHVRVEPDGSTDVRGLAHNLNLAAAQAQAQLADLQHQRGGLQALVDTLPDAILAADETGRLTIVNAPAARLLQVPPAQALRQKIVSVVTDERIVALFEALWDRSAAAAPTPIHREVRLARDGQRLTYQAVATRTAGGGSLVVLRDVSTLAGAIQMKTDFVANASHELRTPIAAIKIAFETLRDVWQDDPPQTERCLAVIEGHLKRLEEMLRDLLDLSRVEAADLKPQVAPIKPAEIFALLRATLGPMARQKNVELCFADDNAPPQFVTDGRLLNLVLKNLIENSIKFTPTGGRVTLTIENDPSERQTTVKVTDTGIGIAPEHLDRVFERFYQVDAARSGSAGRGTGLGLAIVKHAAHALGGTVRLESAPGVGTTVTCTLPQPGPAAHGPLATAAPQPAGANAA